MSNRVGVIVRVGTRVRVEVQDTHLLTQKQQKTEQTLSGVWILLKPWNYPIPRTTPGVKAEF